MSDYGLFWDSHDGDRTYYAASMEEWLKPFFTSGVYQNDLQVISVGGMQINLGKGYSNLDGKVRYFDNSQIFTLEAADGSQTRVDSVVIERNDRERNIYAKVVTGTPGAEPMERTWDKTAGVFQLIVAEITIPAGATEITQANITDTRMDDTKCGYIASTVKELDFSSLAAQFNAYLNEFKAENMESWEAWSAAQKSQMEGWITSEEYDFTQWKNATQAAYNAWISSHESEFATWSARSKQAFTLWAQEQEALFSTWSTTQRDAYLTWISQHEEDFTEWMSDEQSDFDAWFANLQDQLDENQAAHLQAEIDALPKAVNLTLAEYTALSDAKKNNGDIYYISNKGIIYRNMVPYGMPDIRLQDVTSINATIADLVTRPHPVISWTDPSDVVIPNNPTVSWAGTKVVAKVGSAPVDETDGTVLVNETTRNQYASTGFEATDFVLEYDETVYVRFFPYTTNGTHTAGSAVTVTASRIADIPVATGNLVYDGTLQSPTLFYDATWSEIVEYQSTVEAIDANNYTIVFRLKDPSNSKWADGTTENKTITWSIAPKSVTCPTVTDTEKTYNHAAQSPTISAYDSNEINVSGDSQTNAGNYTITFALASTNYIWSDDSTANKYASWSISAKVVTAPTVTDISKTYNRTLQGPTISTYDSNDIIVTGASQINAGSYTLTMSLANTLNLVWDDTTTADKTVAWTIAKAQGSVSVSPSSLSLTSVAPSRVVRVTIVGDGTVTTGTTASAVATVTPATLAGSGNITVTGVGNGSATITVTLAAGDNYLGASATVVVTVELIKIVSWAAGTIDEIKAIVKAADEGKIDLYEDCGWRVGQEKTVSLPAIAASGTYSGQSWTVGESQAAQSITLVLMHKGLYELVNPVKDKSGASRSTCSFVVGLKDSLATAGYMNSSNTNMGSWESSARRAWCNGGFREAMESIFGSGVFKRFKTKTISEYNGSSIRTSNDYFALPAAAEVFKGDSTSGQGKMPGKQTAFSSLTEFNALTRFTYYETSANRMKKPGSSGSAASWWERSPDYSVDSGFCIVTGGSGSSYVFDAEGTLYLAPFGCI